MAEVNVNVQTVQTVNKNEEISGFSSLLKKKCKQILIIMILFVLIIITFSIFKKMFDSDAVQHVIDIKKFYLAFDAPCFIGL